MLVHNIEEEVNNECGDCDISQYIGNDNSEGGDPNEAH
jgi:hypothetical protein